MRKSGNACVICKMSKRHSENLRIFRFPKNNPELYKQWLSICDVQPSERDIFICDKHFMPSDILRKKLKKNAIPMFFLTPIHSISYEAEQNSAKVNLANDVKVNLANDNIEFVNMSVHATCNTTKYTIESTNASSICKNCVDNQEKLTIIKNQFTELEANSMLKDKLIESNKIFIENLENQLKLHRKRIRKLKQRLRTNTLSNLIDTHPHMTEPAKTFVKMQIKPKNVWNDDEKTIAHNMFMKSSDTYRYLRSALDIHLPSKAVLQNKRKSTNNPISTDSKLL